MGHLVDEFYAKLILRNVKTLLKNLVKDRTT